MNPADYPALFRPAFWLNETSVQFELRDSPPNEALIGNVNIIGYRGTDWLMMRVADTRYGVPGGTCEPAEPYLVTIARELLEETGTRLKNMRPLGAWRCVCHAPTPFRPHMPYPVSYRYVVTGEIEVVGQPTNPPGAEQVSAVDFVPLEEVVRRYHAEDEDHLADLYRLAAALRASTR